MRRLTFPGLCGWCLGLMAGLGAYHVWLQRAMRREGLRLGAIGPELAPFYGYWRPHVKVWLIVPVVVLGGYLALLRRSHVLQGVSDATALAAFVACFLGIVVGVALLDEGPRGLVGPLVARPDLEYYGAIARVGDVRAFLRDYPRRMRDLPMHAQTHPPGAILFLWAATRLLGGGPWAALAGILGAASGMVVLVFLWGRWLGGPAPARHASALFVVTPCVVLFTATCMDAVFAVPLIGLMAGFGAALEARPLRRGLAAGGSGGLAALLTYSVAIAGLFCALAASLAWLTRPASRRRVLVASLAALAGFVGVHLALALATGFDPIATFRTAVGHSHQIMAGTAHESAVRHGHLFVAHLVVFFTAVGLPLVVLWWPTALRAAVWAGTDPARLGADRPAFLALVSGLTLLIAAAAPIYTLEVERIWVFLAPLIVLPVAARLAEDPRWTPVVAALLTAQTLVVEVLVTTYW